MGGRVVALLFLGAVLFMNPAFNALGSPDRVILQDVADSNYFSHKVFTRSVVDTDRETVQTYLDRAVVGEKVRKNWNQLKEDPPKAVTETDIPGAGKLVTFENTGELSLKQAFQFMQFYPLLFGKETKPTEFHVPIGSEIKKFKITGKTDGTFSLHAVRTDNTEVDLTNLQAAVKVLSDSNLKDALRNTIEEVSLQALDAKLNDQPDFEGVLEDKGQTGTVSTQERDDAFRASTDFLAGTSIQRNSLAGLSPSDWLQTTNAGIASKMEDVMEELSRAIAAEQERKLKYEFTQSMLKTSKQAIDEWEKLKTLDTAANFKYKNC